MDKITSIIKDKSLTTEERYNAMLALYQFGGQNTFDVLKSILDDMEESVEIRSAAALALGKLGASSLEALKSHTKSENDTLRNYVVQAIGMIGEQGLPALVKALKDQNNEIFYNAADAIGAIGNPAVPYLTELLESGKDDQKCVAAWKLGEIQDTEAIPALIKAVKNKEHNQDIHRLSVWALGEVSRKKKNNKSIISTLYRASRTKNPEVKRLAYIALTKARDHIN